MYTNKDNKYEYDEEDSNNDTAHGNSKGHNNVKESQSNTLIQDLKLEKTSMIKSPDETLSPNNNENLNEEKESESEKDKEVTIETKKATKEKMTAKEIFLKVENKRYELDNNVFDIGTKNQIEEKKMEELANNEEDEEKKEQLLAEMKDLIEKNESNINEMKEYVLNLF